jgi:hypothetical protein
VEAGDPLETGRHTHSRTGEEKKKGGMLSPPRTPGIRFAEQPRIPTKDERVRDEEREREEREAERKKGASGLGKLFRK